MSSVAPGGERRCLLPPCSFCGPIQAPKPDILPTGHTSLGWVSNHACTTSCSQGYTGPDSITSDGSFSHPPHTRLIDSRCFKLEPEADIGSISKTSDPPGHLWGGARPHLHLHPYLPSPENVPSFLPTSPPVGSSLGGSQVLPLIPLPNPAHSTPTPTPAVAPPQLTHTMHSPASSQGSHFLERARRLKRCGAPSPERTPVTHKHLFLLPERLRW